MAIVPIPRNVGCTIEDEGDNGNVGTVTVVIPAGQPGAGTYTRSACGQKLWDNAQAAKKAAQANPGVTLSMDVTGNTINSISYTQPV